MIWSFIVHGYSARTPQHVLACGVNSVDDGVRVPRDKIFMNCCDHGWYEWLGRKEGGSLSAAEEFTAYPYSLFVLTEIERKNRKPSNVKTIAARSPACLALHPYGLNPTTFTDASSPLNVYETPLAAKGERRAFFG